MDFYWILTAIGLAKRAAAETGGDLVAPAEFAVGDGGGEYHDPEALADGLINEVWRGPINRIYVSPTDPTLVVIEAIIPAGVGGWDIREAAVYDADGDRILVGKYPLISKPLPGSGGDMAIQVRGGLRISNGSNIVVTINSDLVMASQEYVDAHAALTSPHGSTSAATPSRLVLRDAAGRAKVSAPAAADDIATKGTVDAHAQNQDNPHGVTPAQIGAAPLAHSHPGYMAAAEFVIADEEVAQWAMNAFPLVWTVLDLSAKIPAGYRYGVFTIEMFLTGPDNHDPRLFTRPLGAAGSGQLAAVVRSMDLAGTANQVILPVGGHRKIEYRFDFAPTGTQAAVIIRLQGYIK
jgi:hypothetical protein